MNVVKIVLKSNKVVLLREPRIADTESAAMIAGRGNSDNNTLVAIKLQKEMVKLLLVEVDGKKLSLTEKEQLDKYFSAQDYSQIAKVVNKITGDDSGNEPTIEFVNIGEQLPG